MYQPFSDFMKKADTQPDNNQNCFVLLQKSDNIGTRNEVQDGKSGKTY